jgi:hypothetical protein
MERIELKKAIAETISRKQENTRARLAYKKANPPDPACPGDYKRMGCIRSYWIENSLHKEQLRHLGLALAWLRGRRYWVCERFTNDPPMGHMICQMLGDSSEEQEAAIRAWLDEVPSEEERLAYEQHLAAAQEKARTEYKIRSAARKVAA